jgi:hypothetical protein
MDPNRRVEIDKALEVYRSDLEKINLKRTELTIEEMQSWKQLKSVLDADNPVAMSNIFLGDEKWQTNFYSNRYGYEVSD